eukprot:6180399-Pleurochrysis_carterae.AAC.3
MPCAVDEMPCAVDEMPCSADETRRDTDEASQVVLSNRGLGSVLCGHSVGVKRARVLVRLQK